MFEYSVLLQRLSDQTHSEPQDQLFREKFCSWVYERMLGKPCSEQEESISVKLLELVKNEKQTAETDSTTANAESSRAIATETNSVGTAFTGNQSTTATGNSMENKFMQDLYHNLELFVKTFGITHYVSSIKLGAVVYEEVTSTSKQTKRKGGAHIGSQIAKGDASVSASKMLFRRSKKLQTIGRIRFQDGEVTEEAVIGFMIEPIHNLVKNPVLKSGLQRAVQNFILTRGDKYGK